MLIMLTHKSELLCVCFCVLWGLFPTRAHLCTAWVGETTRPESALEQKVLNLALVLAVRSRLLVRRTEKTTSLTDITGRSVGGPRTQNNDDWPGLTLQVSNCGLHLWFSRLFCAPLFILMLDKHQYREYLYLCAGLRKTLTGQADSFSLQNLKLWRVLNLSSCGCWIIGWILFVGSRFVF